MIVVVFAVSVHSVFFPAESAVVFTTPACVVVRHAAPVTGLIVDEIGRVGEHEIDRGGGKPGHGFGAIGLNATSLKHLKPVLHEIQRL